MFHKYKVKLSRHEFELLFKLIKHSDKQIYDDELNNRATEEILFKILMKLGNRINPFATSYKFTFNNIEAWALYSFLEVKRGQVDIECLVIINYIMTQIDKTF